MLSKVELVSLRDIVTVRCVQQTDWGLDAHPVAAGYLPASRATTGAKVSVSPGKTET